MSVQEKPWGKLIIDDDTGESIPIIKKRREYVLDEDFSLSADSLVGSCFHVLVGDSMVWQGVVVAEPQPGRYLCYIDRLDDYTEKVQRIFSVDALMGVGEDGKRLLEGAIAEARADVVNPHVEWRLYDSEDEAKDAFRVWALNAAADKEREEVSDDGQ
jgi:hypothetical protein